MNSAPHLPTITAIVIARNEADMIANCLDTLTWCDEVIVVDNGSTDATVEIAQRYGARVISDEGGFVSLREAGLAKASHDWVFYVDADERVTPALAAEIQEKCAAVPRGAQPEVTAFTVYRQNVMYGKVFRFGGWQHDGVVRLFFRQALQGWAGDIHEHARFEGKVGRLQQLLVHLTHRDFLSGMQKTIGWTPIEARLLFEARIPQVTMGTLVRKGFMEFWRRAIRQGGYRDGMAGLIEAVVQAMNRVVVYIQVWELQQQPPLPEQYQAQEKNIAAAWQQANHRGSQPSLGGDHQTAGSAWGAAHEPVTNTPGKRAL